MSAKLGAEDLLRDKFQRLLRDVAAREELEVDDGAAARAILSDLEDDLVTLLERDPLR
jgi:hypothetical protein